MALLGEVSASRPYPQPAAIAGALVGAAEGVSAIPSEWRDKLHGWPGYRYADLVSLTERAVDR